jgi:hypothetical protein
MNGIKVRPDIVKRLRESMTNNMRPGTADSDINVFALPAVTTWGILESAIREIERLRHELNAAQNINWRYAARIATVEFGVVQDPTNFNPSSPAPEPWGSPPTR